MKKDFQKWHDRKSEIDNIEVRPFFHEREVWFCHLGANVGFEQDGIGEDYIRPIIIIRKFNNEIFWAIPLTKSHKKIKPKTDLYYYSFSITPNIISVAILSQIRLIDARRLARPIGSLSESRFNELIEKLKRLFP